jgi:hypothetical protein
MRKIKLTDELTAAATAAFCKKEAAGVVMECLFKAMEQHILESKKMWMQIRQELLEEHQLDMEGLHMSWDMINDMCTIDEHVYEKAAAAWRESQGVEEPVAPGVSDEA